MMENDITLRGMRDISGRMANCSRCSERRPTDGGVELGPARWVCGKCWRTKAARPLGALAALAAERRG
jgi:hypothetical protein